MNRHQPRRFLSRVEDCLISTLTKQSAMYVARKSHWFWGMHNWDLETTEFIEHYRGQLRARNISQIKFPCIEQGDNNLCKDIQSLSKDATQTSRNIKYIAQTKNIHDPQVKVPLIQHIFLNRFLFLTLDHFDNTWLYMCILIQVKRKSFAGYIENRKSKRKDSTILSTTSYFDPIYDILESGRG